MIFIFKISRFCLQMKPGGLVRVHTSALQVASQYKSLIISEETTSDELLGLLLSCYNSCEPIEQFSLYEVCPGQEYQRKLHPDDLPLRSQSIRQQRGEVSHFLVRRNPNYPRRRQILPPINEMLAASNNCIELVTNYEHFNDKNNKKPITDACQKCRNNFKTCDFCNKPLTSKETLSYNPVYSMREIRSVCNAFSAFGIDKKIIEAENDSRSRSSLTLYSKRYSYCNPNSNISINKTTIPLEVVEKKCEDALSENALKGLRNFQYI